MFTARILARRTLFGRFASVVIVATVLGPIRDTQTASGWTGPHRSAVAPMSVQSPVEPTVQPLVEPMVPGPLIDPGLDLRAGPVDIPIELRIPSLHLNAPMLGVGITTENLMDAPKGLAADPVWQKAFWYRGGGIPGDVGTATLAGHVDDVLGRPAVFARLGDLRPGDLIVVHDMRSDLDVRFIVAKTATYSVQQAADPSVLAQIYGSGPVSGKGPQPAPDGLAHLTLITCTGSFVNGSYNRRLVVYATRSEPKQIQSRWKLQACSTAADGLSPCWF